MTKLKLIKKYDEISNIKTFVFEKGDLNWLPGQYQTYVLPQIEGGDNAKTRFFTIASAPSEAEIHISTRVSDSVFKQTLNNMQLGDKIEASGIEGDFTWDDNQPVVMVAGGIGVTPFRSILLERASQGKQLNAHLLYFGRDDNFAFKTEFSELLASHSELKIDYLVGQPITADSILQQAPEAATNTVYLSGPEPMVDSVGEALIAKGVTLKQDWFPGYTDDTY